MNSKNDVLYRMKLSWLEYLELNKFVLLLADSEIKDALQSINMIELSVHENGNIISVIEENNIPLTRYRASYDGYTWYIRNKNVNKRFMESDPIYHLLEEFPWVEWLLKIRNCKEVLNVYKSIKKESTFEKLITL